MRATDRPPSSRPPPPLAGCPVPLIRAQEASLENSLYTLVSFDPDAPSRENQAFGPWRHYIIGGLKPKAVDALPTAAVGDRADEAVKGLAVNGLVERTEAPLSPWVPASPGAGTG